MIVDIFISRSVNSQMDNGATPVYLASQEGQLEVIRYLATDTGASTKIQSFDGMTCVHAAAQTGQLDCVRWLVSSNLDFLK